MIRVLGFTFLALFTAQAFAAEHRITQKDKKFSQEVLEINAGDSVVFVNDDGVTHNVFAPKGANAFNLKIQNPGTESKQLFQKPESVDVRCAIHPQMKLTIKVK